MDIMQVEAKPRTERGGGAAYRLRARNRIPAVLYGNKLDAVHLSLDAKQFEHDLKHLRGENVLIDLTIEGKAGASRVFLKEVQRDPVTEQLLHVDLLKIDETQMMHFSVPIHHVGSCEGIKMGGILDQHLRSIDIRCLPGDLPSHIDADVTELKFHESLHVSDLKVPESIEILTRSADVVFTVLPPKKVEEPTGEPGDKEEEKEPEVIGQKKDEEKE